MEGIVFLAALSQSVILLSTCKLQIN